MFSKDELKILRRKFAYKFLTHYFLYGYMLLFAIISCAFVTYHLVVLSFPYSLVSLLPIFASFFCLKFFIRICATTKAKWKYYKINTYRLKNKTFSERWFDCEMYEPCMRLIIKDLCYEFGFERNYQEMYKKYAHENVFIERKKQDLIAKVTAIENIKLP